MIIPAHLSLLSPGGFGCVVCICTIIMGLGFATQNSTTDISYIFPPKTMESPYPRLLHERDVIHYVDSDRQFVVVGSGAYAEVTLGELREMGTHVVVKSYKDSPFREILREIRLHRYVEQFGMTPKLIGLLPGGPLAANISLVYEYLLFSKSVDDWLEEPEELTTIQWLDVCLQAALTMRHLHQNGVLFNDLHRGNMLVQKRADRITLYFIDFGLATYNQGKVYSSSYGSLRGYKFLAPELQNRSVTTELSDIFALGYNLLKIAKAINVTALFHLAHWCQAHEPENRPRLHVVISRLEDILFEISWMDFQYVHVAALLNVYSNISHADLVPNICTDEGTFFGSTCNARTSSASRSSSEDSISKLGSSEWAWLTQQGRVLSRRCPIDLLVLDEHDLVSEDSEDIDWLSRAPHDSIRLAQLALTNQAVVVKEFFRVEFDKIREEACMTSYLGQMGVAPKVVGMLIEYRKMQDLAFVQEYYGNGVTLKEFLVHSAGHEWNRTMIQKAATGEVDIADQNSSWYESDDVCGNNISIFFFSVLKINDTPVCKLRSYRYRLLENISYLLCKRMSAVHEAGYLINNFRVNNILVKWIDSYSLEGDIDVRLIDLGAMTSTSKGRKFYKDPEQLSHFSYLAPEVVQGHRSSTSSDIYSLCVVLYRIMQEYFSFIEMVLSSACSPRKSCNIDSRFYSSQLQRDSSCPRQSEADEIKVKSICSDNNDRSLLQYQKMLLTCLSRIPQKRPRLQELMAVIKNLRTSADRGY